MAKGTFIFCVLYHITTFLCMIYITQLLQNESETHYDIDKGVEEAEWKEICKKQGIELTLGEGEPKEELLEDDTE